MSQPGVQLYQQKCTACRRDSPPVAGDEVNKLKLEVPQWELIQEGGIPKLDQSFKFRNFEQALAFTNALGQLAESEGHHPRLTTEWGRVGVTWWTHKIRNLHQNDFVMAAKTDQLYRDMSPAGE
jgi:4a-hydroxytetrahydrobiopterin dehydratase